MDLCVGMDRHSTRSIVTTATAPLLEQFVGNFVSRSKNLPAALPISVLFSAVSMPPPAIIV